MTDEAEQSADGNPPAFPGDLFEEYLGGLAAYCNAVLFWMGKGAILTVSRCSASHLHLWADEVPASDRIYRRDDYEIIGSGSVKARAMRACRVQQGVVDKLRQDGRIFLDPARTRSSAWCIDAVLVEEIKRDPCMPLYREPASRLEAIAWVSRLVVGSDILLYDVRAFARDHAYRKRLNAITARPPCPECVGGEEQPLMDGPCVPCLGTGYKNAGRRSSRKPISRPSW